MADTAEDVKTEKVFDIDKGGWIEKPITPTDKNDTPPADPPNPDDDETGDDDAKPAEGGDNPPPDEAKPEKPEEKPEDTKPEEKPLPPAAFKPGDYIKEKYGQEYGLESEEDLADVLKNTSALAEEVTTLRAKVNEPKYRTEQEKKIAEFLTPYDPSKFGEGLNTVAALIAMDPDQISARQAMEESYIINHPNLTRDEAKEKFAYDFDKKYTLKEDDYDDKDRYAKDKRILEIDMKNEEANARKILKEQKEKLKAPPVEAKKEEPKKEEPTISEEVITGYNNQVEKFFQPAPGKSFDRIKYLSDDKKEVLFELVLDKNKVSDLKKFMTNYVKNPTVYDKDGKIPNFDPHNLAKTALRIMFGDWQEEQIWNSVKSVAAKLKAEQIAGLTPEKKSAGGGEANLSIDGQFAALAKKAVEDRSKVRR